MLGYFIYFRHRNSNEVNGEYSQIGVCIFLNSCSLVTVFFFSVFFLFLLF